MKKVSLISMAMALFLFGCTSSRQFLSDDVERNTLRLLMISDEDSAHIGISGEYKIINASSNLQVEAGKSFDSSIEIDGGKVKISGKKLNAERIKIISDAKKININETTYRGSVEISKGEKSGLRVILEVPLEYCIYGIIGREMSASSHSEALKAQAVAIRSFIMYQDSKNKNVDFDMNNSGSSQLYFGTSFEHEPGIKATDATRNVTMKYGGSPAFTPFFSNCGGYTEDAGEVWGGDKLPYLLPTPCYFCKNGTHYSWSAEIEKDHIVESLNKNGYNISAVTDIDPRYEVTKSGRAKKIKITTDKGKIIISITQLRAIVGNNLLKSSRALTARPKSTTFIFTGKGWGHGVGMCQDGANGMAKAGHSYKEILRRYYSGVEIDTR